MRERRKLLPKRQGDIEGEDVGDIPQGEDNAETTMFSRTRMRQRQMKAQRPKENLADTAPSDDEEISQAKKSQRNIDAEPKNISVDMPKNVTIEEEAYLNEDGNPITPKYAGGRNEGDECKNGNN